MLKAYPNGYSWYKHQHKPIYLQQTQPDIPSSLSFPRKQVQDHFAIDGNPNTFFTFSGSWMIAFAIMEGFERIELWGFELRREHQYDWERPCFFYWIDLARSLGIDIFIPEGVEITPAGDPLSYKGPLYGYQTTKPHFPLEPGYSALPME